MSSLPSFVRAHATLAAAVLLTMAVHGRLGDRTTGQPLVNVTVEVSPLVGMQVTHSIERVLTGRDGRFTLHGLHRGIYVLDLSSNDVPHTRRTLDLRSGVAPNLDLRACSTTLDFSCVPQGAPLPPDRTNG